MKSFRLVTDYPASDVFSFYEPFIRKESNIKHHDFALSGGHLLDHTRLSEIKQSLNDTNVQEQISCFGIASEKTPFTSIVIEFTKDAMPVGLVDFVKFCQTQSLSLFVWEQADNHARMHPILDASDYSNTKGLQSDSIMWPEFLHTFNASIENTVFISLLGKNEPQAENCPIKISLAKQKISLSFFDGFDSNGDCAFASLMLFGRDGRSRRGSYR